MGLLPKSFFYWRFVQKREYKSYYLQHLIKKKFKKKKRLFASVTKNPKQSKERKRKHLKFRD